MTTSPRGYAQPQPPAGAPPAPARPHGAWQVLVDRGTETSRNVFHLTADGLLFLADGGAGTWTSTGPDTFTYRATEPLYDDAGPGTGHCLGWIHIEQRASLTPHAFRSEGTSTVHAPTGTILRTKHVTVTARRRDAGPSGV